MQTQEEFREDLVEQARVAAIADGIGTSAAFAEIVAGYLVDTEVLPDYTPAFYVGEGKRRARLRVDGFALDEVDYTMNLVVVRFEGGGEIHRLTSTEASRIFEWPIRFVREALDGDLHLRIEVSTPASDLVDTLRSNRHQIRKFRFLLFTDGVMSERIDTIDLKEIDGIPAECQIWDVKRLYQVCVAAERPEVEIDFTQYSPNGLPCLPADSGVGASYRCFLCVIPGKVLANIYDRWGAQLLEGNVRSFLSTKVAVNKKIRETILNSPAMFFAFNNGVSATAGEVKLTSNAQGTFLTYARDFQIINGGQTTASLSNARHRDKASLDAIMVQMKVTEIPDPEIAQEMVPKIARSSNSQNKVSDADFFSTHPFHIRIEKISRTLSAPAVGGAQYNTYWFYERARGQYLQAQMRMTATERKRFQLRNPKSQVITKTDLAKVLNTWRQKPHIVSKGAQTNFMDFAKWIDDEWSACDDTFNEQFFRDCVSLFILFKHTERLVTKQPWYQQGYRANIVTYSIAWLSYLIPKHFPGMTLDLGLIWNRQGVPDVVSQALTKLTRAVMESITDPNRGVANVTQWCKREEAWYRIRQLKMELPPSIKSVLCDVEDARSEKRQAKKAQKVVSGINAQTDVVNLGSDYWISLANFVKAKRLGSPEERKALAIACQMPERIPNSYQSKKLLSLLKKAREEGYVS